MKKVSKTSKRHLFSTTIALFLVGLMMVSTFLPRTIYGEGEKKLKFFTVEKVWENDAEDQRPESVSIHVTGSDGSDETATLSASEGWKKDFSLPAYDAENKEIEYSVYEVATGLENYKLSNDERNPLKISKSVIIEDNSGRKPVDTFVVNNSGFENCPKGTIVIDDTSLLLESADRTITGDLHYSKDGYIKYTDPGNKSVTGPAVPRVLYTGDLKNGDNSVNGQIVLTWADKAEDYLTGELYDLRITVSNITINSLVDATDKTIAVMSNIDNYLKMESFVTSFDEGSLIANVVGVSADIKIEVLDNGSPVNGFIQAYITDLDVGDYATCYREHPTYADNPEGNMGSYHKIGNPYVEGVTLLNGVASDIYVASNTRLITNGENSRFIDGAGSVDVNDPRNSLEFLATSTYQFRWSGSKCETAIVFNKTSETPSPEDYTNKITNTSSFYKIEYYYQNNEGKYDLYKSSEVTQHVPDSKVSVTEDDKKPELEGYVLDERAEYTKDYEGTVTTSHTQTDPLVLKVYFKKVYTVIYHDNVGNIVWDHNDQTNPNLDYGVATPGYDTDLKTPDIQPGDPVRAGYTFDGWSTTPEGEIITVPATVTGNADYWAHWTPNKDTKYKVEWYYEVNGKYPETPDSSEIREGETDTKAVVTNTDKLPLKSGYQLTADKNAEWEGVINGEGTLVLRIYFKPIPKAPVVKPKEVVPIPLTGIE